MALWGRFVSAAYAFQRAFWHPGEPVGADGTPYGATAFERPEARDARHTLGWALYCSDLFWDEVHRQAPMLKARFGLYAYTRAVFNPIFRLVEFHAAHVYGGPLDKDAGDGQQVKSSIPIETEGKGRATRRGLGRLWHDSRWAIEKDVLVRRGAAMGDAALIGCDNPVSGRVTMRPVHPGTVRWAERDRDTGRVLGYLREEWRHDPRRTPARPAPNASGADPRGWQSCRYSEEAWVEGGRVHYRTYLDGGPFDWRRRPDGSPYGNAADARTEWDVPYPFVPLVLIQHLPVGLSCGLSEGHAVLEKVLELADVGSNLGDNIRRVLNDALAISGVQDPGRDVSTNANDGATLGNPMPGRTKRRLIYLSQADARVQQMTMALDVPGVSGHIQALKDDVNEDYPELDVDLWKTSDPSGRAMRLARQRAEMKVQMRRACYDEALEAMQRMCLAIGGLRGYRDYEGLATTDPWDDPKVAHSIAHRPVFAPDPIDDIAEGDAFWTMVGKATAAGVPLEVVLRREGWSEDDINEILDAQEMADQKQMDQVKQRMQMAGQGQDQGGGDGAQDGTDGLGASDNLFIGNGVA